MQNHIDDTPEPQDDPLVMLIKNSKLSFFELIEDMKERADQIKKIKTNEWACSRCGFELCVCYDK